MLEVDDLVQPRSEQIVRTRRLVLLRSHLPSDADERIMLRQKTGISKMKLQGSAAEAHETLQSQHRP
jgi:hypothetical protein